MKKGIDAARYGMWWAEAAPSASPVPFVRGKGVACERQRITPLPLSRVCRCSSCPCSLVLHWQRPGRRAGARHHQLPPVSLGPPSHLSAQIMRNLATCQPGVFATPSWPPRHVAAGVDSALLISTPARTSAASAARERPPRSARLTLTPRHPGPCTPTKLLGWVLDVLQPHLHFDGPQVIPQLPLSTHTHTHTHIPGIAAVGSGRAPSPRQQR